MSLLAIVTLLYSKLLLPYRRWKEERELRRRAVTPASELAHARQTQLEQRQLEHENRAFVKERRRREADEKRQDALIDLTRGSGGHTLRPGRYDPSAARRELVDEQDEQFQRALAEDMEIERARLAEKRRVELVEQQKVDAKRRLAELKRESEERLPVEPPVTHTENVCHVVVRLLNGERVQRRFATDASIQSVLDLVMAHEPRLEPVHLVSTMPRVVYSDAARTLADAKLLGKAVLFVEEC
eukprot:TRINITY_DN31385_c0_g1_i1.p1 TRINITY_DN31385_c0_g1~~TRINITY_DN31385_c0_g1_i1.p1  ORF type:complete len:284 (+),score=58.75 TRINITY_DN31385_c0_g1_i1:128-853(+)